MRPLGPRGRWAPAFVPSRSLAETGHSVIVSRGVNDGALRKDAHPALDGGGREDSVVSAARPGFSPRTGAGRRSPEGAAPPAVVDGRGRSAENVDLGRRVARFLKREDRSTMDLGKMLKGGDVGIKARAVETDNGERLGSVSISGARVSTAAVSAPPATTQHAPGG